jgi:hypothetical protein
LNKEERVRLSRINGEAKGEYSALDEIRIRHFREKEEFSV